MKVLQVSKYYYPHYGGIESVVRSNAEGIAANGFESRVLAAASNGLGTTDSISGVHVKKVTSIKELSSVPLTFTFPFHLKRAVEGASLVHYHLPNPIAVISHLLVRPNIPTVATYHSDIIRQTTALRYYKPLLNRFLKSIDRIIVTSPRLLEKSAILGQYKQKCTVLPLSIDISNFELRECEIEPKNMETTKPIVLFVGRLSYYKGVEYLIRAMQDVEASLVIIGEGDKQEYLERISRDLGVSEKIQFLGRASDAELHMWYEKADIFVLPSIEPSEAFGVVQLEAMAYANPVINTDLPTGVPWVSKHGETGLTVPTKDSDALANAISVLISDESLRIKYGRTARERVEAKFTDQNRINRLIDCYQSLAN